VVVQKVRMTMGIQACLSAGNYLVKIERLK